jgi:hypothetical protein
MRLIRRKAKLASVFLTILMLYLSVPFDSILAAMIETETTLDSPSAQQARDEINKLLLREDVQSELLAHGIEPLEAKARIDSLSDAEVVRLADQIHEIPAGGDVGYAIVLVLLVALFCVIFFLVWVAVEVAFDAAEDALSD